MSEVARPGVEPDSRDYEPQPQPEPEQLTIDEELDWDTWIRNLPSLAPGGEDQKESPAEAMPARHTA